MLPTWRPRAFWRVITISMKMIIKNINGHDSRAAKWLKKLINEALKIQKAGAFSIVLECINSDTAKKITNRINIPTIGIGSSNSCDGQILVFDDLIGLSGFYPKFVKKYTNLQKIIENVLKKFRRDVISSRFPSKLHTY